MAEAVKLEFNQRGRYLCRASAALGQLPSVSSAPGVPGVQAPSLQSVCYELQSWRGNKALLGILFAYHYHGRETTIRALNSVIQGGEFTVNYFPNKEDVRKFIQSYIFNFGSNFLTGSFLLDCALSPTAVPSALPPPHCPDGYDQLLPVGAEPSCARGQQADFYLRPSDKRRSQCYRCVPMLKEMIELKSITL